MHHDHPRLEEDISPELMERFQRSMANESDLLVRQLLTGKSKLPRRKHTKCTQSDFCCLRKPPPGTGPQTPKL
eukprot:5036515-Amphidinium_carterae.1